MRNSRKLIFFPPLVLACGGGMPSISSFDFMTEDDAFAILKTFVPEEIDLPENHESIKIQNLAPWVVSRRGVVMNNFKISDYKNFVSSKYENPFYTYYISGEEKYFLISPYIGMTVSCSVRDGYLFPDTVFFALKSEGFARMDIERSEEQTKFIYKNSCVVVNNATMKDDPFDLNKSKINLNEIKNLSNNLKETTALPFVKYFYDCAAAQKGAAIVYFDENYFSPKFNTLDNYYINIHDDVDVIRSKIQKSQECILAAKTDKHKPYFIKIFIEFPIPLQLDAVKHVILLIFYQDQWFVLDSNGGEAGYFWESNFVKVLSNMNITLCKNGIYEQTGNGCDTCASINTFLLSSYWGKNKKIDLTRDGDIDFSKILQFAKTEKYFPLPLFFKVVK